MSQFLSFALLGSPDGVEVFDISECMTVKMPEAFDERGVFKWSHFGSLENGMHIIYGYLWPEDAMGKFSGLFVVKQDGRKLKIVSQIADGARHSSMVRQDAWELNKNELIFYQHMPSLSFFNYFLEKTPELNKLFKNKIISDLCEGEACYFGVAKLRVIIMPDGKPAPLEFINFMPAVGFDEQNKEEHCKSIMDSTPPPASLSLDEALSYVSEKFQCQNIANLSLSQINTMMKEVAHYTENATVE